MRWCIIVPAMIPSGCRSRVPVVCVVVLVLVLPAHGRQSAPPPTIRAGVNLVSVDFLALGRDGQPVADLAAGEVALKVDGRTRAIKSLQMVQVGDAARAKDPLPVPFGTNESIEQGRAVILAIDDDSFRVGTERALREAADRFLASLARRDRVAVVTMPYGGTKVDFTTDFEKVRQALSQIIGQANRDETGSDMACRSRRTLESLTGLLGGLNSDDGPTVVAFFSSSLMGPRRDSVITLAPGMCEITPTVFQNVGLAASAARAMVYVVQPQDVMLRPGGNQTETIAGVGFTGSDNPLEGLEHLAGVTGGERLHLATAGANSLNRITRETSAYYLLAFEPEPSERNGAAHRVDLRVTRADVSVRSRPRIVIAKADSRASAKSPRDMLRQPTVFRDLRLRVAGFASREAGESKLKIITLAEPLEPAVKFASMAAGLFDQSGRLTAQWTAEPAQLANSPVMGALLASPGIHRLRVAATDTSGRGGTADYEIPVELTPAGSLELSGLVLGLSRASGFAPKLQFGAEPVALAYLEIFGGEPGQQVSVAVELASSLNGPAMLTVPGALSAGSDRHMATAAIPIGALPPGDFIVRALVVVQGQPAGRVVRTLRKVAPQ
jgi:VWFA-related protein